MPKMNRSMLGKSVLFVMMAYFSTPMYGEVISDSRYGGLLVGYGISHPGFGDTTEKLQVLDILPRMSFVQDEKIGSGWHEFNRELWIEVPMSIILSDSDTVDHHDLGLIGTTFSMALVSKARPDIEPYFMMGGGPVYLAGDINGVGSDLCGHYQFGLGVRFKSTAGRILNIEVRYHHISNMDTASPNVPLNSTKFVLGTTLPF